MAQEILIVDGDSANQTELAALLGRLGFTVAAAPNLSTALDALAGPGRPAAVLADVLAARGQAKEMAQQIQATAPGLPLVIYSTYVKPPMVENLLRHGAAAVLRWPLAEAQLAELLPELLAAATVAEPAPAAPPVETSPPPPCFPGIIGASPAMQALFAGVAKVADSDSTVMIHGESGTGKELVAHALHDLSARRNRPFVAVNCAAIPDELLESELFGHKKGSFTGAVADRAGCFEQADGGTLFLDEIGDMKLHLQVKLLRVIQGREVVPVGAGKAKKIDVRLISATHQNLEKMVHDKLFREDLFYRLAVIPLTIPPLRDRGDDIRLLLDNFVATCNQAKRQQVTGFAPAALAALHDYPWPGNVRELENLVERLVVMKQSGPIELADLPLRYQPDGRGKSPYQLPGLGEHGLSLNQVMADLETKLLREALERTAGNRTEAAELLQVKRTTLIEKLKRHNLA